MQTTHRNPCVENDDHEIDRPCLILTMYVLQICIFLDRFDRGCDFFFFLENHYTARRRRNLRVMMMIDVLYIVKAYGS